MHLKGVGCILRVLDACAWSSVCDERVWYVFEECEVVMCVLCGMCGTRFCARTGILGASVLCSACALCRALIV